MLPRCTLFALFALLVSCASDSTIPSTQAPKETPLRTVSQLTPGEKELVDAVNTFGIDLFQRLVATEPVDANVFISPLSASYCLAMAYNGADGATKDAIADVLRLRGISTLAANSSYYELTRILSHTDTAVSFNFANAALYRAGTPVSPFFMRNLEKFFGAKVAEVDFTTQSAVDSINAWADAATNGKIPELISAPLDANTVFMLMNAIYFKGSWTYPFDPDETFDWKFHTETGDSISCRMMYKNSELDAQYFPGSENDLLWFGNDTVTVGLLPYGNRSYQAAIIVPKEPYSSRKVCMALTATGLQSWFTPAHRAKFDLILPRLRFEYGVRLDSALRAMGMDIAFSGDADFSKMITSDDQLYISEVGQKTFLQVDELGTEAAATTWAAIADSAGYTPVVANRPFIFVIYEKTSGAILFLGRIGRPEWNE